MAANDEAAVFRARLTGYVSKIPAGVVNGSWDTVQSYKRWVGEAKKALGNKASNESVLRSLCTRYEGF